MQSSLLPLPAGFTSAREVARRAWLILAVAALVPGWSAARAMSEFLTVGDAPPLSDGAPSLWAIVQMVPWLRDLPLAALAMAMAVGAGVWLAAHFSARPPRGEAILRAALLVALALPLLLPHMRPADFLAAVALSIALAIRQRGLAVAALLLTGHLLAIIGLPALGAVPMIAAIAVIARSFLDLPANDNGLPLNPYSSYPA
jgi:hypothetical protein